MSQRRKKSRQNNPKANSRTKHRAQNQDKHRWRKVGFALFPIFIGSCLTFILYPHKVVSIWSIVLVLLSSLGFALLMLEWYILRENADRKILRAVFTVLGLLCVLGGAAWQWNLPKERLWLVLSDEEKTKFIELLASQTGTRKRVRIGCPVAREDICVLVTPFVDSFKRGRFVVVDDEVERTNLAHPKVGVILFQNGSAAGFDPQNPDHGVWAEVSDSLVTIERAFAEVGIKVQTAADRDFPEDVMGVYFGIEPQTQPERIDFDKLREQFNKLKQDEEKQSNTNLQQR